MAMAMFAMVDHGRPRGRPDARRLHHRQLLAGRGSSTSTCRSASLGIFMTLRYVHEPDDVRAREPRRAPRSQRKNLDCRGHRADGASASARCSTCSRRARATTGSTRRRSRIAAFVAAFALAAFVIRELTARRRRRTCACSAIATFASGTADRRRDVRDADGQHVPAAGVHAGAAWASRATQSGIALMPRTLAMMVVIADRRAALQPRAAGASSSASA